MDKILVSVCISVFNGEGYLRKCLDSIASQDICDMEIILVDDGSTDHSLQIMQQYREEYPELRIKIIEQKHSGLSEGRKTGFHHSAGEYVTFLDDDDYLLDGAYRTVIQFMKKYKADIYEFQTIREGYYSKSPYSGIMSAGKVLNDYFNGVAIPVNYWLRWFKRELLSDQVFPEGISLHEDVYAFPCILNHAETIAYIEKPLHVHTNDNQFSIMNSYHAVRDKRDSFENQKTLLLSIPHIIENIGKDTIEKNYRQSFARYEAKIYRNFIFMDVKGISYKQKLDEIINTLELSMSGNELERYIAENISPKGKLNRAIRYLGLCNAYLLYRMIR